jgi:hypothetical protein
MSALVNKRTSGNTCHCPLSPRKTDMATLIFTRPHHVELRPLVIAQRGAEVLEARTNWPNRVRTIL